MRAFLALLAAVLISIGIGVGIIDAVGTSTETSAVRFTDNAIASIGSSPYVQSLTVFHGTGLGNSQSLVNQLSLGIDASSDDGATPLASAKANQLGIEIYLARQGTHLVDIRIINEKSIYVTADLAAISTLPGLSASDRQQLKSSAPLLGNQWFELPESALGSISGALNNNAGQSANNELSQPQQEQLLQKIATAARSTGSVSTTTAHGLKDVHASVNVLPFVRQLLPTLLQTVANSTSQLPRSIPKLGLKQLSSLKGVASVDLYAGSETAALTKVNAGLTNSKVTFVLSFSVSHARIPITVPASSIPLPKSAISAFGSAVKVPGLS